MTNQFDKDKLAVFEAKLEPYYNKAFKQESFTPQEIEAAQKLTVEYYTALKDMGVNIRSNRS